MKIQFITYKESKKLAQIIHEKKEFAYMSRFIGINELDETRIANLLFDYKIMAFIKTINGKDEVCLYQIPSAEEKGNLYLTLISKFDDEFLKETVEYIRKEYKEFGWENILVEYISKGESDVSPFWQKAGFNTKVIFKCNNESYRNIAAISI